MSVWSNIEGTAKVPKVIRVGLKEIIKDKFHKGDYVLEEFEELEGFDYHKFRVFKFSFRYENDGMGAAHRAQEFIKELEWYGIQYDFVASIRFLG